MRVVLENLEGFEENEDFAKLLEESEKSYDSGTIKDGVIVSINGEYAMIDVGEKIEGRLNIAEIKDSGENLLFKEGDKIEVYVSQGKGERPNVSYKKAIRSKKVQEKIKELGEDYKDKVIEGKIIRKNKGGYIVESDGIEYFMPKFNSSLRDDAKNIDKKIKACVVNIRPDDDSIVISRKRFFEIDDKNQSEVAKTLVESGKIYKGIIKSITAFGMFIEVEGVEGLVHYTEISHRGPVNPARYYKEGDEVEVKAISYDEAKRRLSFSIKAIGEDPWKEIQKELKTGYAIKVVVSNIEPYGAFVDIGNDIEGFLHISEISWSKDIKHPEEYLKIGQEIDVEVIEIDSENRRLRVSLKKLLDKPFNDFIKKHRIGDVIKGKIATLTDFGAFVNFGGLDGLLHNDDTFWDRGQKCKDIFTIGEEVEVKLTKIDKEKEKISLSMKALKPSPTEEFAQQYNIDDVVNGKVVDIRDFGIFIKIGDMDALIKNEDLFPLKKEDIKIDDDIEGVVAFIDKTANKVRVSIKRLERKKEKDELKAFNSNEDKMTLGDLIKDRI
ncbi:30S ribosomal protein S1 [Helicobacter cappadocius]|uniref:30S ribosomal protein S1 n=1 Tax=Helicobacter cappadocius TaxID=3063998 RepID=A0AA90PIP4_9HELI|nr:MULTISPECIES: 30S ribosomal protein S1 [unclassified Helicobacter]MDO7252679.1 30S ribosomal protein S1 [Helicobacter sp. faydin-H75]MDP2538546.1 30S ribosomal protein S1 [Helicobacter sp. faydin-H76]